jgi:hypothetical protein
MVSYVVSRATTQREPQSAEKYAGTFQPVGARWRVVTGGSLPGTVHVLLPKVIVEVLSEPGPLSPQAA